MRNPHQPLTKETSVLIASSLESLLYFIFRNDDPADPPEDDPVD